MVVGCWGPRQQGRTSSSDYVTPVTAAPVRGCTPDCLRKPVTGHHPSCGREIPVSLPLPATRAYARGLQGYHRRTNHPRHGHPRSPSCFAPALARSLSVFLPFLRSRPPSRPNQPLRQRQFCRPSESTAAAATLASFLRSHGHHFRWKVLGGR